MLLSSFMSFFPIGALPMHLASRLNDRSVSSDIGKTLKTKKPKTTERTAVQRISAKDGGELVLETSRGIEAVLFIPPGSLNSDQEVSLTELEEPLLPEEEEEGRSQPDGQEDGGSP